MKNFFEGIKTATLVIILFAICYFGAKVYIDSCDYIAVGSNMTCVMDMG